MKKGLDIGAMQNELTGSAFFRPSVTPPRPDPSPAPQPSSEGDSEVDHSNDISSVSLQRVHEVEKVVDSPPPVQVNSVPSDVPPSVPSSVSSFAPPPERTPVRTKRTMTRYAFEFFRDQIESLQEFRTAELVRGEKGNMSSMVREALDSYIARRRRFEP